MTNKVGISGDTHPGNVAGIGDYLRVVVRYNAFNDFDTILYNKSEAEFDEEYSELSLGFVPVPSSANIVPDALKQVWWGIAAGRSILSFDRHSLPEFAGNADMTVHLMSVLRLAKLMEETLRNDLLSEWGSWEIRSVRIFDRDTSVETNNHAVRSMFYT